MKGLTPPVDIFSEGEEVDWEKLFKKTDFGLILAVVLLIIYGAVMIYSATYGTPSPLSFLKRQIVGIVLGVILLGVILYFNYNSLSAYTPYFYLGNIFLLILVALVGHSARGAQRWLTFFGFQFQPSELAKILLIITLASFLASRKGDISKPRDLFLAFLHIGIPLLLIASQPDLGTSLVLVAILMGMLLVGGTRLRYYLAIIFLGLFLAFSLVRFHLLDDYQMQRLTVFFNPQVDITGAGYNLLQSKIAVGSGKIWGKGLLSGTQTNLKFLPNREADFIFAVVGEELGLIGATILLTLYFLLISRAIRVAALSKDLFGSLVAVGIVSMWLFQIFVNIGMSMGIMPITGIPLPLVSYGGSAMVTNLLATGLLLNIYRQRLY